MRFYYNNLAVGNKFTVPRDPTNREYIRVRGGFVPDKARFALPMKPGDQFSPLKNGMEEVEYTGDVGGQR